MRAHLVFVVSAALASSALIFVACASADLQPLPQNEAGPPICATNAEIRCDASAPSKSTCVGDPDSGTKSAQLPTDQGYADGCQAFFRGTDCSTIASCQCIAPEAGSAAWSCTR